MPHCACSASPSTTGCYYVHGAAAQGNRDHLLPRWPGSVVWLHTKYQQWSPFPSTPAITKNTSGQCNATHALASKLSTHAFSPQTKGRSWERLHRTASSARPWAGLRIGWSQTAKTVQSLHDLSLRRQWTGRRQRGSPRSRPHTHDWVTQWTTALAATYYVGSNKHGWLTSRSTPEARLAWLAWLGTIKSRQLAIYTTVDTAIAQEKDQAKPSQGPKRIGNSTVTPTDKRRKEPIWATMPSD